MHRLGRSFCAGAGKMSIQLGVSISTFPNSLTSTDFLSYPIVVNGLIVTLRKRFVVFDVNVVWGPFDYHAF